MTQRADYFKLGIFVLVGFALCIAGVLALGADELLDKPLHVVTYMDESVKGLEIGSVVRYRGVPRGQVVTIRPASEALKLEPDNRVFFTQGQYIEVLMEFDAPEFEDRSAAELRPVLNQLVEQGLRAQLSANPLTGRTDVEIDYFDPEKYPSVELNWVPEELHIPWARGTLSQVKSAAERILEKLESEDGFFAQTNRTLKSIESALDNVRLEKVQDQVLGVIEKLNDALDGVPTGELVADVRNAIDQIDRTVENLDRAIEETLATYRATAETAERAATGIDELVRSEAVSNLTERLDQISADLAAATAQVPGTVAQVDRLVRRLDGLLGAQSADVRSIVDNLRRATADLKEIARNGRLYPSWILFGAPPTPSGVGK